MGREWIGCEREGTYPVILDSLTENRVGVAASVLGVAKGAYEEALDYARTRIVAGKPILQYQAVAHRLADMITDIEAAHWMVYHGAWRVDQGTIDHASAAKIKLFASEATLRVTEGAMRVLGGASIMREYSVGRHHRDARCVGRVCGERRAGRIGEYQRDPRYRRRCRGR